MEQIEYTIINPYNQAEECKVILKNGRKIKYYKHKYIPDISLYNKYEGQTNNMNKVFNMEPDYITKRCNCVSIVLYSMGSDVSRLKAYLLSVQRSVKNIYNNLNGWVTRLYIDYTVYDSIYGYQVQDHELDEYEIEHELDVIKKCKEIMDDITNNYDNVEIYTILCQSTDTDDRGYIRIYRFFPLLDTITKVENNLTSNYYGTNVSIIREADGIVSLLDCRNIQIFAQQQQKVFYLIPYFFESAHTYDHYDNIYAGYSHWLAFYKKFIDYEYFSKYNNLYDMLAGTIGVRYKVRTSFYYESISNILSRRMGRNILSIDEELLLELFKTIISAPIINIEEICPQYMFDRSICYEEVIYNDIIYEIILSDIIYERHNIVNVYFNIRDPIDSINMLIDMGILLNINMEEKNKLIWKLTHYSLLSDHLNMLKKTDIKHKYLRSIEKDIAVDRNINLIDSLFNHKYINHENTKLYNIITTNSNDERVIYNDKNNLLALVNIPYCGPSIYRYYDSVTDRLRLQYLDEIYDS